MLTRLGPQNCFFFSCYVGYVAGENTSDENSNALLEEYFLQEEIGEHPNIVKFLLGGLLRGKLPKKSRVFWMLIIESIFKHGYRNWNQP